MPARQDVRGYAVAAAGGALLAVSPWLHWYSFRIPGAAIDSAAQFAHQLGISQPLIDQGVQVASHLGTLHVNAWQVYTSLPAIVLVCAVVGGGLSLLALTDRASEVHQLVLLAGVVTTLLVLSRLIAQPLNGQFLHPDWGFWAAAAGGLVMALGGALAAQEGQRRIAIPDLTPTSDGTGWSTARSVPPPSQG
jgi:hypothetical protein